MGFLDLFRRAAPSPPAQIAAPATRGESYAQGWANATTGLGVDGFDSATRDYYAGEPLVYEEEARRLWSGDGLAARLAAEPVRDAWAPGWTLGGVDEAQLADLDDAAHAAWASVRWRAQAESGVGLDGARQYAEVLARVFGGALIVAGHDDLAGDPGALATRPLRDGAALLWVRVYQRWEVTAVEWGQDPEREDYGQVTRWLISPRSSGAALPERPYQAHASRCIAVQGRLTDSQTAAENQGWGDSIFRALGPHLARWGKAQAHTDSLFKDLGLFAYGMDGLAAAYSAQGASVIQQRLQLLRVSMGKYKAVVHDKSRESADFRNPSVSGVDKLLEAPERALCAVTGVPATVLFGGAPSGLSTDDASGTRNYDKLLEAYRDERQTPLARQLLRWACAGRVPLPPTAHLLQLALGAAGAAEEAEVTSKRATSVSTLVSAGVPLPAAAEAAGLQLDLAAPTPLP